MLRCLAGLYQHWKGELRIDGKPLGRKIDRERCRQVQMVFQDPYGSLHPRHTIDTALASRCKIHGMDQRTQRIDADPGQGRPERSRSATAIRTSCPAASASAWRSRAR